MKSLQMPDLASLESVAEAFVALAKAHRIIAVSGEMGAGKTTFIQAVCKVLGVSQTVNSPTFALINEYFTNNGDSIFHFDLYRIENPVELFDIGYEDYFFSGEWCFIEWPEKARQLVPEEALQINIIVMEDGSRQIRIAESDVIL